MKKVLRSIFAMTLAFVLVLSLVGCYGGGFLKQGSIDRLAAKLELASDGNGGYVNPTAEIKISFEGEDGNTVVAVIRYELLFDKAPITVNNFIALAQEDFYDGTLIDTVNAAYCIAGRYKMNDSNKYELKTTDFAIKGEFISNGWSVDGSEDGAANALHELGCLGMYHDAQTTTVNYFDSASTAFYIVWSNSFGDEDTFKNNDYAVFAKVVGSYFKVQSTSIEEGNFYGKEDFRPGLDNVFVDYLANADSESETDSDGKGLSATPSIQFTITDVTIIGATGKADTSLRIKVK